MIYGLAYFGDNATDRNLWYTEQVHQASEGISCLKQNIKFNLMFIPTEYSVIENDMFEAKYIAYKKHRIPG